jgi:hypothetical protein
MDLLTITMKQNCANFDKKPDNPTISLFLLDLLERYSTQEMFYWKTGTIQKELTPKFWVK